MVGGEGTSNRNFGGKDLVPSYLIFGWFLPVDGPRRTSFSFPHLACNGRRDLGRRWVSSSQDRAFIRRNPAPGKVE